MAQDGYEFTREQNAVIRDLARKMHGVGIFMLVLGALSLVGFVAGFLGSKTPSLAWFPIAVFLQVIGLWTVRAGREFRQVAATEGQDIQHLMTALAELKKFYTLHFWLFVVYLVLIVLTILGIPQGLG
jgi:hypothetical protein